MGVHCVFCFGDLPDPSKNSHGQCVCGRTCVPEPNAHPQTTALSFSIKKKQNKTVPWSHKGILGELGKSSLQLAVPPGSTSRMEGVQPGAQSMGSKPRLRKLLFPLPTVPGMWSRVDTDIARIVIKLITALLYENCSFVHGIILEKSLPHVT